MGSVLTTLMISSVVLISIFVMFQTDQMTQLMNNDAIRSQSIRLDEIDNTDFEFYNVATSTPDIMNSKIFHFFANSAPLTSGDIYSVSSDGVSDFTDVTSDGNSEKTYLSIFPDGKKVAYIEAKDVFIDDGTTETNLTSDGKNSHVDVSSFNEKIAYSSITTGAMEIWVMNADGSGKTKITNGVTFNSKLPSWKSDGTKIAYVKHIVPGNAHQIWIMDADGGNQTQLTTLPISGVNAISYISWSNDGNKIAFIAKLYSSTYEMFMINSDGSNADSPVRVTETGSAGGLTPAERTTLDWSPDDKKIIYSFGNPAGKMAFESESSLKLIFSSNKDGNWEIYSMNMDGSELINLTNNPGDDINPKWSPDGSKISFTSDRDGGVNSVFVMNADGTNQTNIIPAIDVTASQASWHPDGDKLLVIYKAWWTGDFNQIYSITAAGATINRLTDGAWDDYFPTYSPDGTKIVFSSTRDGNTEIYTMNADGSNQTNISNNSDDDYFPSWSPDGTKIKFTSYRDGDSEIYVMDADGSNQINISNNPLGNDTWASWSQDGTQLIFNTTRDGDWNIYKMNADGSGQIPITFDPSDEWYAEVTTIDSSDIYVMNEDGTAKVNLTNNKFTDKNPAFSPDRSKISFESKRPANIQIVFESNKDDEDHFEIYTMNQDGTNLKRLTFFTKGFEQNRAPKWSPDGQKIVFRSNRDGNNEVYVMDADGSNQTNLSNHGAGDNYPSWFPDGTKILFNSERVANKEIYVMDADGSNKENLTNHPNQDLDPSISPDGTKIVFYSQRDGNREIYVMDADGGNQTNISNHGADDVEPSWSPNGNRIVFSSSRDGGNYNLFIVNADGSDLTQVTDSPDEDRNPSWSYDPTVITFQSKPPAGDVAAYNINTDGTNLQKLPTGDGTEYSPHSSKNSFDIYIMNSDGTGVVNLSQSVGNNTDVSFSPDGLKLVFESDRDGNYQVYKMDVDGTNQVNISNNAFNDKYPSWSPDGNKILFNSDRDGDKEIFIMNTDGTVPEKLTNDVFDNYSPTYSPDGTKIAFVSNRDGNKEIYTMNADGSNQINISNNAGSGGNYGLDDKPEWSPDGKQVGFISNRDGRLNLYKMNADGSNIIQMTFSDSNNNANWATGPISRNLWVVDLAATTTTSILGGVSPDPDKAYEFPIWHYTDSCKAEFWIKNIGQEPIYKFSDMSVFIDFDDGSDLVLLKYFKGNYEDLSPGEWTYVIPDKLDDLTSNDVYSPGVLNKGEYMRLYIKTLPAQSGAGILGVSTDNGITKMQPFGADGDPNNKSLRCGTKD